MTVDNLNTDYDCYGVTEFVRRQMGDEGAIYADIVENEWIQGTREDYWDDSDWEGITKEKHNKLSRLEKARVSFELMRFRKWVKEAKIIGEDGREGREFGIYEKVVGHRWRKSHKREGNNIVEVKRRVYVHMLEGPLRQVRRCLEVMDENAGRVLCRLSMNVDEYNSRCIKEGKPEYKFTAKHYRG